MKRPNIRGLKTKAIRIDPSGLAVFRERLKDSADWSEYAEVSESELVTCAVVLASLYISPEVQVLPKDGLMALLKDSIRENIGAVARALDGAAQLNDDMTITVAQQERETVTFRAVPPRTPEKVAVN